MHRGPSALCSGVIIAAANRTRTQCLALQVVDVIADLLGTDDIKIYGDQASRTSSITPPQIADLPRHLCTCISLLTECGTGVCGWLAQLFMKNPAGVGSSIPWHQVPRTPPALACSIGPDSGGSAAPMAHRTLRLGPTSCLGIWSQRGQRSMKQLSIMAACISCLGRTDGD